MHKLYCSGNELLLPIDATASRFVGIPQSLTFLKSEAGFIFCSFLLGGALMITHHHLTNLLTEDADAFSRRIFLFFASSC